MERGVGIGGLADNKEAYTTSRFNHYAPYTFETEVKTNNLRPSKRLTNINFRFREHHHQPPSPYHN